MRAKQKVKRTIAFCICIMMLLNLLPLADMCMDGALGIVSEAEAAVTSMSASEYNSKVNSFLSDSRYKGGAVCTNCYDYTNWFTSYMFGRSPRGGDAFSNPSEIRAGDILHFYHSWSTGSSQHWIVVLSRDGNSLYTAEGNVSGGKVRISNSQYWIEGNQLKERGSTITSFDSGWHHANISGNSYTVSYNANGGTGAPGNQTKTYGTDLTLSSTVPTRTGYTFTSWNTKADGSGTSYAKGAKYTSNASVVLYAQWKQNVYNPSGVLDSVSGGVQSISIKGWAFDRDDLSKALSIHVYIGGPAGSSAAAFVGGLTANKYREDVAKTYPGVGDYHGYEGTFPTSKTGTQTVYVYAINVGSGANVLLGTKTVTIEPYTIMYNANGGTGAPGNQTKTYGTDLTLSSTVPTRTGYTFTSWNTKADGSGTSYAKGAKYTSNASVVLYAQWKQNVYNPSGVLDSVSGGVQSISIKGWAFDRDDLSKALSIHVYIGGPAGSSAAAFVGGLTANKYREDVAKTYPGVGDYHGYEGTFPTSKTGTQTVYVYAINVGSGANVLLGTKTVTIEPYTIMYNANGGTGAPGNQTKTYGNDLTLSSTVPTRTGYTFTSWNTKADGTGTSYAAGAKYIANESVTLYAQWKAESAYKLRLEGSTVRRGEQVAIPVYVEGIALGSMTIRVTYDSTKLKYIENSYSAFESTVVNDDVKGVLIIAAMNESKGSTGKLFVLNFEVVAEKTSETAVHVTVEESIDEKERNVSLTVQDAVIKITNLLLGDVNGDGKITALDARWVLQAAAGKRALKEYAQAADVNGDGKITALDARWILQAAAGKRKLQ